MKNRARFCGWVRIDDRLIHGQVTVGWYQYLRYHEIWVVDDTVYGEPYLWDAMRLAAPVGVGVQIMELQQAIAAVIEDEMSEATSRCRARRGPVLMLLRDPEGVLALLEGGVSLVEVNVGNVGSRSGSVRAIKNVSLTDSQIVALDVLAGQGVEVFFQPTPEDARVGWAAVRRRLRR